MTLGEIVTGIFLIFLCLPLFLMLMQPVIVLFDMIINKDN